MKIRIDNRYLHLTETDASTAAYIYQRTMIKYVSWYKDRLSGCTQRKERALSLSENASTYPSGMYSQIALLLKEKGITFTVVDARRKSDTTYVNPGAVQNLLDMARNYQEDSLNIAVKKTRGVIVAPTGCIAGDSIIGFNRAKKGYKQIIEKAFLLKYDGRKDSNVPTKVRVFKGKRIGLHPIEDIVYSGKKLTYILTLENGKSIRATPEHLILTDTGWVELQNLTSDSMVLCEKNFGNNKKIGKKKKSYYKQVSGLKYHKYANKTVSKRDGRLYRVPYHRLVIDASENNLTIENFIDICKNKEQEASFLKFLDPMKFSIHHIDGNTLNNSFDNLKILTLKEHTRLEGKLHNWRNIGKDLTEYVKVESIKKYRVEHVFDIKCEYPYHNFVANGIVVHNSGKTFIMALIVAELKQRTIIVVPNTTLLKQIYDTMAEFFGKSVCGKVGGGQKRFGKLVTVATIQTLWSMYKKGELTNDILSVGCYMSDEAHHSALSAKKDTKGNTFYQISKKFDSFYKFGFTATPGNPSDPNRKILESVFGKIIVNKDNVKSLSMDNLVENGHLSVPNICMYVYNHDDDYYKKDWLWVKKNAIVENPIRNSLICELVLEDNKENEGKILVAVDQVEQGKLLLAELKLSMDRVSLLIGEDDTDRRKRVLNDFKNGYVKVLISTLLGEGYDFRGLRTVVNAYGGKSEKRVVQLLGRSLRSEEGKTFGTCIDILDRVPNNVKQSLHVHALSRKRTYNEVGFNVRVFEEDNVRC